MPTIRIQQFSDSFKGFTFIVDKKVKNEIKNVFIHDSSNTLKNIVSNTMSGQSTTIVAKEGIVEEKTMLLFNGQIISTDKNKFESNVIKFEQLNINLKNLETDTIKDPKLQETSTISLAKCIVKPSKEETINCKENTKKEIITVLNRRLVLPLYIPIISLLSSFLLIKVHSKKSFFLNKYSVFLYSFLILLYAELIIRYTGISKIANIVFFVSPIVLIPIIYIFLSFKLSKEAFSK